MFQIHVLVSDFDFYTDEGLVPIKYYTFSLFLIMIKLYINLQFIHKRFEIYSIFSIFELLVKLFCDLFFSAESLVFLNKKKKRYFIGIRCTHFSYTCLTINLKLGREI